MMRQITKQILFNLTCVALLTSCLPGVLTDDGRTSSGVYIEDFTLQDTTADGECGEGDSRNFADVFVSNDFTTCLDKCADNQHIASEEEVNKLISDMNQNEGLSKQEEEQILEVIAASNGVCVDDIKRPDNAITIKNFCGCKDSTPIIQNDCANYCAGKSTGGEEMLFVEVLLAPEIEANEQYGTLKNWCTLEIGDGKTNPSCNLELTDNNGSTQSLPITNFLSSKSISVDMKTLASGVTYIAKIVESTSVSDSSSFQVRRLEESNAAEFTGPLGIHPVAQYTCMTRSGTYDGVNFTWTNALRLHYYYTANNPPPSLPPVTNGQVYCHDINIHGNSDSPLYERLEHIPQHFAVWNYRDTRFVDTDKNGKEDINDLLKQKLADEYQISRDVQIFGTLRWPNVIPVSDSGSSTDSSGQNPIMGYYMIPWVNSTTGKGFCPGQDQYNGSDPMFRVMKDYIGVDTEGIFLAEREALAMLDSSGNTIIAPTDIIIIRESLLKKIWFYYENNQHLEPDDFAAENKTVMFYWPPDIDDPYVRKSTQYIYTVKSSENIGSGDANGSSDLQTSIRPPDKRFGCVPSLGDVITNPL